MDYFDEILDDDYLYEPFKSAIIGVLSSEVVSVGIILLFYCLNLYNSNITFLAIVFMIIGEYGLFYSDVEINPSDINYYIFAFDSAVALLLPFVGGSIKLISVSVKIVSEEVLIVYGNLLIEKISINYVRNELVLENVPHLEVIMN